MLVPRIVVDVNCDATEGGDFGGEFVEEVVVLPGSTDGLVSVGAYTGRKWTYLSRSYASDILLLSNENRGSYWLWFVFQDVGSRI